MRHKTLRKSETEYRDKKTFIFLKYEINWTSEGLHIHSLGLFYAHRASCDVSQKSFFFQKECELWRVRRCTKQSINILQMRSFCFLYLTVLDVYSLQSKMYCSEALRQASYNAHRIKLFLYLYLVKDSLYQKTLQIKFVGINKSYILCRVRTFGMMSRLRKLTGSSISSSCKLRVALARYELKLNFSGNLFIYPW